MKLSERLRELREGRGWTLAELATHTGFLSVAYLSDLERERSQPAIKTLVKLADAYDMTVQGLIAPVDFGEKVKQDEPLPFEELS